jgi:hypothetical protein
VLAEQRRQGSDSEHYKVLAFFGSSCTVRDFIDFVDNDRQCRRLARGRV